MKRLIGLIAILLCCSCDKIETFYPIDEPGTTGGRSFEIVKDSSFACTGSIDMKNGSYFQGIQFDAEIKNHPQSSIASIEFSVKPGKKNEYETYSSVDLVGTQNAGDTGPLPIEELIKVANNQTWTAAVFYFEKQQEDYDSLYLKYRIDITNNNIRKVLEGEKVYKRGYYIQPLSR